MEHLFYYIWLSCIDGIGPRTSNRLLQKFKDPEKIWKSSANELIYDGVSSSLANQITKSRNTGKINALIESLKNKGISCFGIHDENYPERLKSIYDPPIVLYVKGEFPDFDLPHISVIGTRKCSEYGANSAYSISRELSKNGVVIVSGMAAGIDSMAHKGALAAMGKTVAVLGSGVDICFPASNETLMRTIIKNGCVVSEYPPGTKAQKYHFPARNRIISGLSDGVLVVEAGEKSGTLITVDFALDQGRDVFAMPGNITSNVSVGTNSLIKQGAILVANAQDVLDELAYKKEVEEGRGIIYKDNPAALLDDEELIVFNTIGKEPVSVESIAENLGLDLQTIIYILTCLEIKGIIVRLPGNRYIKD